MATVYSCENKCAMNYSIVTNKNWNDACKQAAHQCTTSTPMTTLTHCTCTSSDAWRTTCIESAHIAHCSTVSVDDHTAHFMAQVLSAFTLHPWSSTWRTLLDSLLHFSSTSSSCLSPSSSSTSSCSLSSTTRRSWQTCAAPLQKRVRTP